MTYSRRMVVLHVPHVGTGLADSQGEVGTFRLVVAGSANDAPAESTECRAGWSERGFHLFARMRDSGIVPGLNEDEVLHFRHGDTLELFLKPAGTACYAEMYVTPLGRKSTLFFRAPRREPQPDPLTAHDYRGLRVESRRVDGGWEAEMHVPAEELRAWGGEWGPGSGWTFLVGRYNHGSRFPAPELSVFPPVSAVDFHRTREYAMLEFVPPSGASEIAARRRL